MKHFVYGLIIAALSMPVPAMASMACSKHDELVKVLNENYQEFRIGLAISGKSEDQNIIELFVSKKGTWTAMKTAKDGMACLVDSGEAWTDFKPEIEGKKS